MLRELRHDPHRLLVTILVGNNVVDVAIASLTTVLVTEYPLDGTDVTVATIAASFLILILILILIFGEIVPMSHGLGRVRVGHDRGAAGRGRRDLAVPGRRRRLRRRHATDHRVHRRGDGHRVALHRRVRPDGERSPVGRRRPVVPTRRPHPTSRSRRCS
ncbi:DUF21 domain-containing protein [Halobaculum lipolyticum]|uniref:DUF21 domain-containing protein n=1 Tax=Halobaculum lipolyticum TaxID=3032001 RepID=A0ABD5W9H5_9EURY